MSPGLVKVSELDADVDVDGPDVSASWIRRHEVLKQCLSSLHATMTELQLRKLADHLQLCIQVIQNIQQSVLTVENNTNLKCRNNKYVQYRSRPEENAELQAL